MTTTTTAARYITRIARLITTRLERGLTPADVAAQLGLDVDEDTYGDDIVCLPGWFATDGHAEIHFPDVESGEDAAEEYVAGGDWGEGERNKTLLIEVYAWRRGYCVEDGEVEERDTQPEAYTVQFDPIEPVCDSGEEHDWVDESVRGNGGGVIVHERCAVCGLCRITDTWATNPVNGTQGHTEVRFEAERVRAL